MTAHIVFFQPKAEIRDEDRIAFARQFERASREIASVRRAVVGRRADIDPGYVRSFGDGDYSFAAIVEFDDREGLVAYLQHPLHKELGRLFWLVCERTAIVEVTLTDARAEELSALLSRT